MPEGLARCGLQRRARSDRTASSAVFRCGHGVPPPCCHVPAQNRLVSSCCRRQVLSGQPYAWSEAHFRGNAMLQEIRAGAELVAIHDSARPLVTAEETRRCCADALQVGFLL